MITISLYSPQIFRYTGSAQSVVLPKGKYMFECWGAKGYSGVEDGEGGNGGYTKGIINLKEETTF